MIGKTLTYELGGAGKWAMGFGAAGSVAGYGLGWLASTAIGGPAGMVAFGAAVGAGAVSGVGAGLMYGTEIELHFKTLGMTPPKMIVRRLADKVDKDGRKYPVLELSNVKIIDVDVIQSAIDNHKKSPEDQVLYNFSDKPSYSVRIVLKRPGITLAELDYSSWEDNDDFDVVVEREENGKLLEVNEEKRKEVLESLEMLPKFLGEKLYHPGDEVTDKIERGTNFRKDFGVVGGFVDDIQSWINYRFRGKVTSIKVNLADDPSRKIETEEFLDEIAEVAVRTGKYKEILWHYEKSLTNGHKTALVLRKNKKQCELDVMKFAPSKLVTFGLGALTLVLVGLAIASIFPPISTVAGAFLLLGVATVPFIATCVTGYFSYKKYSISREIKLIEAKEKYEEERLAKKFAGFEATRESIKEVTESKSQKLILEGKDLGDSCARVIGKWMEGAAGKYCRELKLANNNISQEGVTVIANVLKRSYVNLLDLRNNPIDEKGALAISDALAENLTLTEFLYDYGKYKQLSSEIEKQLLMNRYLQGLLSQEDEGKIKKYFGNKDELQKVAIEKIEFSRMPLSIIDSMPQEASKVAVQRQLNLLFEKKSPRAQESLATYAEVYKRIELKNFGVVNQGYVLEMIKAALFKPEGKQLKLRFISNEGLKALRNLEDQERKDLLARCFIECLGGVDEKVRGSEARGVAALISRLMDCEAIFDPKQIDVRTKKMRECIEKISILDEKDKNPRLHFEKYLNELKSSRISEKDFEMDGVVQAGYQGYLEGKFRCLIPPFGSEGIEDLVEHLKENTDLLNFDFPKPNNMNQLAQDAISNTVKRNKLRVLVERPASIEKLKKFIEIYKGMDPEYLTNIDPVKLAELIKVAIPYRVELIGGLKRPARRMLLEVCFKDQKDFDSGKRYTKEELKDKALLVAVMFGSKDFLDIKDLDEEAEEFLRWAFKYGEEVYDFDDLMSSIIRARFLEKIDENEEDANEKAMTIDAVIQEVLQAKLEEHDKYGCLVPPFKADGLVEFKCVVDEFFDLREFEFLEGVDSEVKEYVEKIIERNKNCDEVYCKSVREEHGKDSDALSLFMGFCKEDSGFMDEYFAYLRYRVGEDEAEEYFIKELNSLVEPGVLKLAELEEGDGVRLLEHCFGDDEVGCRYKAALVYKLVEKIAVFEDTDNQFLKELRDDCLQDSFLKRGIDEELYYETYESLRDGLEELKNAALKEHEYKVAELIDESLQFALQKLLVDKYDCLGRSSDANSFEEDDDVPKSVDKKSTNPFEEDDDVPEVAKKSTNPFEEDDDVPESVVTKSTNPFEEDDDVPKSVAKKSTNPFEEEDDPRVSKKGTNPFEEGYETPKSAVKKPEEKFVLEGLRKTDQLRDPRKTRVSEPRNRRSPTSNRLKHTSSEDGG